MADRITQLRARQAQVHADMETLLNAAANEAGRDLTAEEQASYDALVGEDDRLTANITRETDMERRRASVARPIAPLPSNPGAPGTVPAQAATPLEPGIMMARFAKAICAVGNAGGVRAVADYADKTWGGTIAAAVADNMQESVGTQGGYLVNTNFSSDFTRALTPQVVVRQMGATVIPLTGGNLTMRKQTSTTSASWGGERQAIPTTAMGVDKFTMAAKSLFALAPIANQLLQDNSIEADTLIRDDLVRQVAIAEDQQFLRGQGSELAPTGLRYLGAAANVIAANAAVNVQNVRNDLGKLRLALTRNNIPMSRPGYIVNPTIVEFLAQLQTATGAMAFPEIADGRIGSYPFRSTTSVPDNLGDNGNQSELYFADFAQVLIGDTMQTTLAVSTEASYVDNEGVTRSAFQNNETLIRIIERVDLNVRYDAAIAILTGAAWFPGASA